MESPPSIVGSLVSSRSLDSFGLHELVLSNGINVTYKVSGGGGVGGDGKPNSHPQPRSDSIPNPNPDPSKVNDYLDDEILIHGSAWGGLSEIDLYDRDLLMSFWYAPTHC